MPKKKWSAKDERKYEHILASCKLHAGRKKGATKTCKRIAAATVDRDIALKGLGDPRTVARVRPALLNTAADKANLMAENTLSVYRDELAAGDEGDATLLNHLDPRFDEDVIEDHGWDFAYRLQNKIGEPKLTWKEQMGLLREANARYIDAYNRAIDRYLKTGKMPTTEPQREPRGLWDTVIYAGDLKGRTKRRGAQKRAGLRGAVPALGALGAQLLSVRLGGPWRNLRAIDRNAQSGVFKQKGDKYAIITDGEDGDYELGFYDGPDMGTLEQDDFEIHPTFEAAERSAKKRGFDGLRGTAPEHRAAAQRYLAAAATNERYGNYRDALYDAGMAQAEARWADRGTVDLELSARAGDAAARAWPRLREK